MEGGQGGGVWAAGTKVQPSMRARQRARKAFSTGPGKLGLFHVWQALWGTEAAFVCVNGNC